MTDLARVTKERDDWKSATEMAREARGVIRRRAKAAEAKLARVTEAADALVKLLREEWLVDETRLTGDGADAIEEAMNELITTYLAARAALEEADND